MDEMIWSSGVLAAAEIDENGIISSRNPTLSALPGAAEVGEHLATMVAGQQHSSFLKYLAGAGSAGWIRGTFSMVAGADDLPTDRVLWATRQDERVLVLIEVGGVDDLDLTEKLLVLNDDLASAQRELTRERRRLEQLLDEVRTSHLYIRKLEGILPICSKCHLIRDDTDAWRPMADYLLERGEVQLSHGYCPECLATTMAAEGL